jgi:hypothetical protein
LETPVAHSTPSPVRIKGGSAPFLPAILDGLPHVRDLLLGAGLAATACDCGDLDCSICDDRHAAELAARLGLTSTGRPGTDNRRQPPTTPVDDRRQPPTTADNPDGITLYRASQTAAEIIAAGALADDALLPPLDDDTASQDGRDGSVGPRDFFDDYEPDACDLPYNDYDFAADREAACEVLADRSPVWDTRRGGWVDDDGVVSPEDDQTADPAIDWANVENALEAIHATLMDAACEIAFQQGWSLGYRGLPVIPLRGVTTAEQQAFEDGLRAGDRERQEDEDATAALAERYFRPAPGEGWAEAERERVLGHRFVG